MSNTIDNRVVSMEFDNAKFEKNVETSLNTLKHLDSTLDELTTGSKAFDGVSFENLANQVDKIANSFTLMGRITLKVFDEIANAVVDLGKKIIHFNTDQLASGWEKYGEKTTSVQTIMSATGLAIEEVSEQLDRLNRFTDETSYSFTDMTSNIAKFTSQGIDLDSAVTSMQGIATWAASAGQNAQAASRAMYNISQAMGAGSMKLIDWKSIQNANMATKEFKEQAIKAAVAEGSLVQEGDKFVTATGKAEVTVKNFDQTLQKGWFTSGTMTRVFTEYGKFADLIDETTETTGITVSRLLQLAEAQEHVGDSAEAAEEYQKMFDEYFEDSEVSVEELQAAIEKLNLEEYKFSKGTYKAAQEAKTFGDAIDATKDALSTTWMNVFETIFGNYEQARVLWTDMANWMYDIFAEPVSDLNDLLDTALNTKFWEEAFGPKTQRNVKDTALAILDYGDAAEEVFKNLGIVTQEDIDKYGSIKEAIENIDISAESVGNLIDQLLGGKTGGAASGLATLEEVQSIVHDIWRGDYGNGRVRRDALTEAGYDPEKIQNALNKLHAGYQLTEEDLQGIHLASTTFTEDQIKGLIELKKRLDDGTASTKEYEAAYSRLTGRELLFDKKVGALYNLMEIVKNIKGTISDAWNSIFAEGRVDRIYNFIAAFQALTMKLRNLTSDNETFSKSFQILFTLLKIGGKVISSIGTAFTKVIGLFKVGGNGLSGIVNKIHEWVTNLDKWLEENEIFEKAIDTVVGWFKTFKEAIAPVISNLKEFIGSLKETGILKQIFEWFSAAFAVGLKGVNTVIEKTVQILGNLVNKAIEFYNIHLESAFTKIQTTLNGWNLDRVVEMFVNAKDAVIDFFKILWDFIKTGDWNTFVEQISTRFETLVSWVKTVKDIFEQWFANIDKDTLRSLAILAGGLLSFIGVLKLIKNFVSIKYAFIEFLSDISSAVKRFARAKMMSDILKIAASIGILAASLYLIAKIPSGQLQQAAVTLLAIILVLTVLIGVIGLLSNTKGFSNIQSLITSVTAFCVGITLLVASLWVLTKMDYTNIKQALGTLAILMMSLVLMAAMLSKANTTMGKAGLGVVAYAAGIILLVKALKVIQNDTSSISADAFKKLFVLITILIGMGIAMRKVKLSSALGIIALAASLVFVQKKIKEAMEGAISIDEFREYWKELLAVFALLAGLGLVLRIAGKGSLKSVLSILALIGLLYVVAGAIEKLGIIPTEQLVKGSLAIVAMGLVFAALIYALGQTRGISKSAAKGILATIIGLIAILIAMVTLAAIAKNDGASLAKGIIAIVVVLAAYALVLKAMSDLLLMSKKNKETQSFANGPIIVMILGMLGLMAALYMLAKYCEGDQLLKAAGSMAAIIVALSAAVYILSKSNFAGYDTNSAMQQLVAMVVALIPALAALWIIQTFNIQASIETIGALSLLIIALAAAIRLMNDSKGTGENATMNGLALIAGAVALVIIAQSLKKLDGIKVEGLLTKVAAMSILIVALSAAMLIMAQAKFDNFKQLGLIGTALGGLVVVIGIIAYLILPALEKVQNIDGLIDKVSVISILLIALAAVVLALSYIPDTASLGAMSKGVLVLGELILLIITTFLAIGALCSEDAFPKAGEFIIAGADILGEALGKFVGAFLGGLVSGAAEAATDLDGFAKSLEPFIDQVKRFDDSSIAGVKALSGLLLALAASDLASAISTIFNPGAWLSTLFGNGNSSADKLVEFANAIKEYVDALKDLDAAQVDKVARITEAITSLLNAMPEEGGLFSIFTGSTSNTFSSLRGDLESFGQAIIGFVDSVKDIPADAATKTEIAVQAVNKIIDMSKTLENTGGLIQSITGIKDIGLFGDQLNKFVAAMFGSESEEGEHVKGFLESLEEAKITDEKIKKIDKLKEATVPMIEIARSIPTIGGFIEKAIGTSDPAKFAESMSKFAESIKETVEEAAKITDADIETLKKMKQAALALAEVGAAEKGENIDLSLPKVTTDSESTSDASSIADTISGVVDKISGIDVGPIKEKKNEITEAMSSFFSFGGEGGIDLSAADGVSTSINGITDSISNLSSKLGSIGDIGGQLSSMFSSISTATQGTGSSAIDAGASFISNFIKGIEDNMSDVTTKVGTVASESIAALESGISTASTLGFNFVAGFAQGITDGTYLAEQAARAAVDRAEAAIKAAQDSNSPAKLTQKYGKWFSQGYAIGILGEVDTIQSAATEVASVALSTIQSASELINEIIEEEASPVIRPVLDLSEIQNGANMISNLTGGRIAGYISGTTSSEGYRSMRSSTSIGPTYNVIIDGIKYNTDDYVDTSIQNFVETMVRKNKMYSGR